MRRRAFTLVELLVVVVILGVIAAILVPIFASARVSANQAQCLSNFKQLGAGFWLYTDDHDDAAPAGKSDRVVLLGVGWAGRIYPYVKNPEVYRCRDDGTRVDEEHNLPGASEISYAINSNLEGGVSLEALGSGNSSVLFFEVSGGAALLNDAYEGWRTHPGRGRQMSAAGDGVLGHLTDSPRPRRGSSLLFYATGRMANSGSNERRDDYAGRRPRHGPGSMFLAFDGHATKSLPEAVCAGRTAARASSKATPSGCAALTGGPKTSPCAAGTEASGFRLTFSLR